MRTIYEIIQQNPDYFAWAFGIINVAWGLFVYFNKQSHDRALKRLEQDLKFNADRRLKLFDLKATQYGKYVTDLDEFGKRNQSEIPAKMQPIFDEYLRGYLAATQAGDKTKEHEIISWFGNQVSALMREGMQEVVKLKSESNRLKLIATDEKLVTFSELEQLTQKSMDLSSEFMNRFTDIVINQKNEESQRYQEQLTKVAQDIQRTSQNLLIQMRSEINGV